MNGYRRFSAGLSGLFCLALCGLVSQAAAAASLSLEEVKDLRKEAAHRERRIIFDNDGNEVVYYMDEATPEALLSKRTTPLAGTQVDTILYCTWSSGFGNFTHNTKVGELFTSTENKLENNKTKALIEKGLDPLEIVVDWCHENGIEAFWSLRMNDTHDASTAWYGPLLFPGWKREHPEFLLGSKDNPPERGRWTAVDFGHEEVRDRCFAFVEEVCGNYDIDGVNLDFFRHLNYFQGPAQGGFASGEERAKMTELMRRIRAMADEVGARRGRPILISVRVPDSVEYCRAIGLDLVRWLEEDLVDMLAVSGYFRINPWETSVALGHRYGVPVYPCLSEPRFRDERASKLRASDACYRARAANALNAGADGIYLFNFFNPHRPVWSEIGSMDTMAQLEKVYTTGARRVAPAEWWLIGGMQFVNRRPVSPANPRMLEPGVEEAVVIPVGEDPAQTQPATWTLTLRMDAETTADGLEVTVNREPLTDGQAGGDTLVFDVPVAALKQGVNRVFITAKAAEAAKLMDIYLRVTHP